MHLAAGQEVAIMHVSGCTCGLLLSVSQLSGEKVGLEED